MRAKGKISANYAALMTESNKIDDALTFPSNKVIWLSVAALCTICVTAILFIVVFFNRELTENFGSASYILAFLLSTTLFLLILTGGFIVVRTREQQFAHKSYLTAKRLAEDNLRQGFAAMQATLQELPLSVFICNEELEIIWMNVNAKGLLDREDSSPEDTICFGTDIELFENEKVPVNLYALDEHFITDIVYLQLSPDERLSVKLSKTTVGMAGETLFIFSVADLSEKIQVEKALMQARKMESIGQLAAGITSEFNTPAQCIGPNIDFILDAVDDLFTVFAKFEQLLVDVGRKTEIEDNFIEEQLTRINTETSFDYLRTELPKATKETRESIDRITKTVRVMKKISQPFNEARLQPLDVNAAIKAIMEVAGSEWDKIAEIKLTLASDLQELHSSAGELSRALQCLIEQSLFSIQSKSKRQASLGKGNLEIVTFNDGEYIKIVITDDGKGLSPEFQQKLASQSVHAEDLGEGWQKDILFTQDIIRTNHEGSLHYVAGDQGNNIMSVRLLTRRNIS